MDVCGAEDGVPVVLCHGTPGSRVGPRPRGVVLYWQGVRLISYDRPGYGRSPRAEDRSVVDTARDVKEIVDGLGIDRFAVVGRSGGGPHALAVAARLQDRVTAVAALVSLAPYGVAGLDWEAGMTADNVAIYGLGKPELEVRLSESAMQAYMDPESLIRGLIDPGLIPADLRVVGDVAIRRQLAMSYREGLICGRSEGWVDDILAVRKYWGFDPEEIKVPTLLWHGERDEFSPASHTRWLGSRIPESDVEIGPGLGHFGAVEALPGILAWVVEQHEEAVRGASHSNAEKSVKELRRAHAG